MVFLNFYQEEPDFVEPDSRRKEMVYHWLIARCTVDFHHKCTFWTVHASKPIEHLPFGRHKDLDFHGTPITPYVPIHIPNFASCRRCASSTSVIKSAPGNLGSLLPHPLSQSRHYIPSSYPLSLKVAYHRPHERNTFQHHKRRPHGILPLLPIRKDIPRQSDSNFLCRTDAVGCWICWEHHA